MSFNNSFEGMKKKIDSAITDTTRCYLLIKYAFNTDEETKIYKEEFEKRYLNLYKIILETEKNIDNAFDDDIKGKIKDMFYLSLYKEKMAFLDSIEMEEGIILNNEGIDKIYEDKLSNSTVKLNFYHNNNLEFGSKTRFHVSTTKYGSIDPRAHSEEEMIYIFEATTNYFKNKCLDDVKNNKKKILKPDM